MEFHKHKLAVKATAADVKQNMVLDTSVSPDKACYGPTLFCAGWANGAQLFIDALIVGNLIYYACKTRKSNHYPAPDLFFIWFN